MSRKRGRKPKPLPETRRKRKHQGGIRLSTGKEGEEDSEEKKLHLFKFEKEIVSTRITWPEKFEKVIPQRTEFKAIFPPISITKYTQKLVAKQIPRKDLVAVKPKGGAITREEPFAFYMHNLISTQKMVAQFTQVELSRERFSKSLPLIIPTTGIQTMRKSDINLKQVELKSVAQEEKMEFKIEDPFFVWSVGSPYINRRPRIILHIDSGKLPTLEMLRICLRDTFTELEGGEPGAYSVEFIANEPRFPEIPGNIVTLDLTGEGWEARLRNREKPVIERSGYDIVPKLKEITQNAFTGQLGFLVINLPANWQKSMMKPEFVKKLVSFLSASKGEKYFPPVLVSESKIKEPEEFWREVYRYFGLKVSRRILDKTDTVSKIEELYNHTLRKNDWRRIAITKRQGEESDEHYFIKASIAEGVAKKLHKFYETDQNEVVDYNEFLEKYIIENTERIIVTEEKENAISDIILSKSEPDWVNQGINGFFNPSLEEVTGKIYIEVETGRLEGGFNFRKIREKLVDYNTLPNWSNVWIVIPPRLLYRGKKRAKMLLNLVKNHLSPANSANLAVPIFNTRRCIEIRKVTKSYINKIYTSGKKNE